LRATSDECVRDLIFLAHRIPYPPDKGDKIRAWHFLRHFAQARRVHVGCFVDDEHDWSHVPHLKTLGGETCVVPLRRGRALARSLPAFLTRRPLTVPYYHDRRLSAWVGELVRRTRPIVFAYSSSMAQYAVSLRRIPRVVDFVDVDSQKWFEYASHARWPVSSGYRREARRLLETEREIARTMDASIFVSDAEAALFRRLAPDSSDRVFAVSNGVDAEYFSPHRTYDDPYAGTGATTLCFTGMMDYRPNVDAVTSFARSVLPRFQQTYPSARFCIVGANPAAAVRHLANQPGISVTGRVPDVRPYLAHAAAVVAPLRIARGVQNKVLEAMAMGRHVVATSAAVEGLAVAAQRNVVIANSADEFIRALEHLWSGDSDESIGRRAREVVLQDYNWARHCEALDAVLAPLESSCAESG
jgi:sugar transferase (PEP-CTERM/EpsH1 system associated)